MIYNNMLFSDISYPVEKFIPMIQTYTKLVHYTQRLTKCDVNIVTKGFLEPLAIPGKCFTNTYFGKVIFTLTTEGKWPTLRPNKVKGLKLVKPQYLGNLYHVPGKSYPSKDYSIKKSIKPFPSNMNKSCQNLEDPFGKTIYTRKHL